MGQPPSGGCVLKLAVLYLFVLLLLPAAFRRLCVETETRQQKNRRIHQPPSGGCVLKLAFAAGNEFNRSAAFGRLRVET